MKKIMFNDKYRLTRAVLEGSKTMTRRVIDAKAEKWERFKHGDDTRNWDSPYQIIEKIAIAQSYYEVYHSETPPFGDSDVGVFNKMFVKAERMPHHIEMLNYHVERLQDISDEDCIKEGIKEGEFINTWDRFYFESWGDVPNPITFKTPRKAFAALIDKVSGKGTWESNPLVWAYEFKLID